MWWILMKETFAIIFNPIVFYLCFYSPLPAYSLLCLVALQVKRTCQYDSRWCYDVGLYHHHQNKHSLLIVTSNGSNGSSYSETR